jgi:hypothetical protein
MKAIVTAGLDAGDRTAAGRTLRIPWVEAEFGASGSAAVVMFVAGN